MTDYKYDNAVLQQYIDTHKKSYVNAIFLAILFGPFGLFYSSILVPFLLLFVCFFSILLLPLLFPLILCGVWFISFCFSIVCTTEYNNKLEAKAKLLTLKNNDC